MRAAGVQELLLPGYVEGAQQFLSGLHLYLQPSRSEGFGNGVHEAMVAALPVLASAVGDLRYNITDEVNGLVVPPENEVALADALHRLLSRPERLEGMGKAARSFVFENFSQQRFEDSGAELFRRMQASATR